MMKKKNTATILKLLLTYGLIAFSKTSIKPKAKRLLMLTDVIDVLDVVICSTCGRQSLSLRRSAFSGRFTSYNSRYIMISNLVKCSDSLSSLQQNNCKQHLAQLIIPSVFKTSLASRRNVLSWFFLLLQCGSSFSLHFSI